MRTILILAFILLASGCGEDDGEPGAVPDEPTYTEHIAPILDRLCNDCHGVPAANDAPSNFRLDICASQEIPGAREMATSTVFRMVVLQDMPPSNHPRQPTDVDRQTIDRWEEQGASCP